MSILDLKHPVKWYIKRLFPHPLIEFLLIIIIGGQYLSITYLQNISLFIYTSEFLLLPMYGIGIGVHFIRGSSSTVIELSILKSYRWIYLGKLIAVAIGLTPIIILDILILEYYKYNDLILPLLVKLISYIVFTIGASLFKEIVTGSIVLMTSEFLFPMSTSIIINNLPPSGRLDTFMSIIVYFFSPLIAYSNSEVLSISIYLGSFLSLIISIIALSIFLIIFEKMEYNP